MGYLDDNGLARLWEKIKSRVNGIKNVIAPAPNVPINVAEQDTVYLNQVVNSEVVSSHFITGGGGTKVRSHNSGADMIDGVIEITSTGVNIGVFTPESTVDRYKIDTGFAETPKIFKVVYESGGKITDVCEYYPQLQPPYNLRNLNTLPLSDISCNNGIITMRWSTAIMATVMWQAYV